MPRVNLNTSVQDSAADAKRWRFLAEDWNSTIGGLPLHEWLAENAPHRGSLAAALDWAINYHESAERHIA